MTEAAVIVACNKNQEKVNAVVATNEQARELGINATEILKVVAETIGGKGGGKPDFAQGSGSDSSQIKAALTKAGSSLKK